MSDCICNPEPYFVKGTSPDKYECRLCTSKNPVGADIIVLFTNTSSCDLCKSCFDMLRTAFLCT